MAIKAKDLRREAGKLAKRQQEILDAAEKTLTPEQEAEFDRLHEEEQKLLKQAGKIEQFEQVSREEIQGATEVEKTLKVGDLTPEKKKEAEKLAMKSYLLTGAVPEELRSLMRPSKKEKNDEDFITRELADLGIKRAAQQSTTDGYGGYTIPQGFQNELEVALKEIGGLYSVSRILRTDKGNQIDWPTVDDTGVIGYLLSEATSAETSATKVTDARTQFDAYKFTSGLIRFSREVIEDSAFDIQREFTDLLVTRLDRAINFYATQGTGSNQPAGVTVGAGYGASFADGGAPTYDETVNLLHALDPAYRRNARWMFHDRLLKVYKKMKDSQNLPVWLQSMRDGEPDTLFGYPFTINQDMHYKNTNSAKIALFGDFKKFIIRQVNDMRVVRLNERFGDTDEIGVVAFYRFDSKVLNAGKNPIVYGRNDAT